MKTITIDDQLYALIASQTKYIGESASDILRRILIEDHGLVEGKTDNLDANQSADVAKEIDDLNKANKAREEQHRSQAIASDSTAIVDATEVFSMLSEQTLKLHNSKVDRFLAILSALYRAHKDSFDKVLEIKGKGRLYFATSKEALLEAGSSTNPKQIPDADYWVVTNNNTAKKLAMLQKAAAKLGYSDNSIQKLTELFDPQ